MAGTKRFREPVDGPVDGDVHPSRKRKVHHSEADQQLSKIYNDLADNVQSVRITAAGELLKNLSTRSTEQSERIHASITRLIKGLCSGRKAARLGFSIALAEVLRLHFASPQDSEPDLKSIIEQVMRLTEVVGNVSGQERRDYLLGRRAAYQAVLQSDVGLNKRLADSEWRALTTSIFDLASGKPWLRRECGFMLYEYLAGPSGAKLSTARVQAIVDDIVVLKPVARSSDGVALWLLIAQRFPQATLRKDIWAHGSPLSSKERPLLGKIMLENAVDDDAGGDGTGARQSTPSHAWLVVLQALNEPDREGDLVKFWSDVVAGQIFSSSSSAERKSLGLQVLTIALSSAREEVIPKLLHANILRYITDQRGNASSYLHQAAKTPLNRLASRAQEAKLAKTPSEILRALIVDGTANFDQATKTKTFEAIISEAKSEVLYEIVDTVLRLIKTPYKTDEQIKFVENQQRGLADLLLTAVRQHRKPEDLFLDAYLKKDEKALLLAKPGKDNAKKYLQPWIHALLQGLVELAYIPSNTPPYNLSDGTLTILRSRLMSCIGVFVDLPMDLANQGLIYIVQTLEALPRERKDKDVKATSQAYKMVRQSVADERSDTQISAFQMLFSLCIIQVHNGEPDGLAALEDLIDCYQSRNSGTNSATMLTELLLSFVSKQSALFRKLAEQVFAAFAPLVNIDSLLSLTEILDQQENLSGQQELFAQQDEHVNGHAGSEEEASERDIEDGNDDDVEMEDVEDASDVEIVNGEVVRKDDDSEDGRDSSSDQSSSDEEHDSDADEDDDEEAIFDRKLAEALKTSAPKEDGTVSDSDSDMDDEAMMALEPHLAAVFAERKKAAGTTQTQTQQSKSAKQNIQTFKLRVLDLLAIYLKTKSAAASTLPSHHCLETLCRVIRTTDSKQVAEKAFATLKTYFDSCAKHKLYPIVYGHSLLTDSDNDTESTSTDADADESHALVSKAPASATAATTAPTASPSPSDSETDCDSDAESPLGDENTTEALFRTLAAIHAEMQHLNPARAKMHASACNRASLFLARVLCFYAEVEVDDDDDDDEESDDDGVEGKDGKDGGSGELAKRVRAENFERVSGMYHELMVEWWAGSGGAKDVAPSVFTEWTSWCIGTRKK